MNPPRGLALAARTKSTLRVVWQQLLARARRRTAQQSEQFELALSNIAQGLCMFDASGRLMLCNQRYLEIYDLSGEIVKPGCTLAELIAHRQATGLFSGDPEALRQDVLARASKGIRTA